MEGNPESVFITTVNNQHELVKTRLLVQSLKAFGGVLRDCPVWIFVQDGATVTTHELEGLGAEFYPLTVPETIKHYWFARKVCTCAQAENMAIPAIKSIMWLSYDCLVLQPPVLLQLNSLYDAAFRPVHGSNIGLPVGRSLNDFWKTIYEAVGISDSSLSVESYVDRKHLRAYFNSHIFSWNPNIGLAQRWLEIFEEIVCNRGFQKTACGDILHQVFLHQAVLSALVESMFPPGRLRILPPDYSYPYNMQASVPPDHRAVTLNDLVCIAYEDRSLHPSTVDDIEILEPLRGWLAAHCAEIG